MRPLKVVCKAGPVRSDSSSRCDAEPGPAEQRVASMPTSDPAAISESSITTVARQCQTSETTVLRFCRAIGLAGYPELRIALARAAQWEEADRGGSAPKRHDQRR